MLATDRILSELRKTVVRESGFSRRLFLAYGAALSSLPLLSRTSQAQRNPRFSSDPFTLGVASGDPDSRGMVLWTRLAPQPLEPLGGMPNEAVEVRWEIAEDESLRNVVASGRTTATVQLGHSVHVEVDSLAPDRWYWYRFSAGDAQSPVGRTRTLPEAHSMPEKLKFAFASCQNYEQGFFTAYEQMARDDLDLVVHLGDYIYESGGVDNRVRKHHGAELNSLDDYRARHAQYRADPALKQMHALCPWFVTWDDHEFDNNWADDISEEQEVHPAEFLIRRASAFQAYYEAMPLRASSLPTGSSMGLPPSSIWSTCGIPGAGYAAVSHGPTQWGWTRAAKRVFHVTDQFPAGNGATELAVCIADSIAGYMEHSGSTGHDGHGHALASWR